MRKYLFLLLVGTVIATADDQQPFHNTSVAFHVGYGTATNNHVIPEFDFAMPVGKPISGWQMFEWNAFQVAGVNSKPLQLQVEGLAGTAAIHQLGEYVYYGGQGGLGVARDATNTGLGGKFTGVVGYRFGKAQHFSAEIVAGGDYSSLNAGHSPQLTFTAYAGVRYGFNRK